MAGSRRSSPGSWASIRGHHDLHEATPVGEHLRHAIVYQGRWLGLATWGAAAFHIKDRDPFIGWDFEPCRRRPLPANNSRVLILPDDRLARWGHPLAMVESFVDPRLHQGTACKVSGGSHLGRTTWWWWTAGRCATAASRWSMPPMAGGQ